MKKYSGGGRNSPSIFGLSEELYAGCCGSKINVKNVCRILAKETIYKWLYSSCYKLTCYFHLADVICIPPELFPFAHSFLSSRFLCLFLLQPGSETVKVKGKMED